MVVAEGYLLELERRGYLQAGAFIPEVVLEHPEVVKALHEEFVHAGSDVVVAFTVRMRFYGVKNNIHCNVRKFTCNTALGSCADSSTDRKKIIAVSIMRHNTDDLGFVFFLFTNKFGI